MPSCPVPVPNDETFQSRAEEAIKTITSGDGGTKTKAGAAAGLVKFLQLDLNDLHSVACAADAFAAQETRLDVLWNNAGPGANVLHAGAKTAQGLEPTMGIHCVATLLLTVRLLPLLQAAAAGAPPGATRVVWTTSFMGEGQSPPNGVELDKLRDGTADGVRNYAAAKAGVWMLGRELAARQGGGGTPDGTPAVLSVVQNPGNVRAGSYDGNSAAAMLSLSPLLHETKSGVYTELFAGLAPDVAREGAGCYVVPWGRVRKDADCPRKDILEAMKREAEGGKGYGKKLWDWCEEQWKGI